MRGVFDSLSDAIIIVEKKYDERQSVNALVQEETTDFVLCNRKSQELFGLQKVGCIDPVLQPKFFPVLKSNDGMQY